MNGRPVAQSERQEIRSLYQTGLFDQRSLGDEFKRSKGFISTVVAGMERPTNLPPRNIRNIAGPPIPPGQSRKPVLKLSDLRPQGRRSWWPGVSDRCEACNGLLMVRPPTWEMGAVTCAVCSREPYEVSE